MDYCCGMAEVPLVPSQVEGRPLRACAPRLRFAPLGTSEKGYLIPTAMLAAGVSASVLTTG
jgi:hypothetical protein